MRQTQSESQSSWSHYAKAAAVFTLTTATYLVARTTGWLPGWLSGEEFAEDSESTPALDTSSTDQSIIPPLTNGSGENFQLVELTTSSFWEDDCDKTPLQPTQYRLLQQSSQITVANSIPDQVIQVNQQYTYLLDNAFSGNYSLLGAVETGQNSLPSWLNLQPKLLSTYSIVNGQASGLAINGNKVFLANGGAGLQIIDVSDPGNPMWLSTYYFAAGGWPFGVVINGDIAFIAAGIEGIQIINVSNLGTPSFLSSYPVDNSGEAIHVTLNGSIAFVADSISLQIIDVSNMSNPRLLSSYAVSAQEVAVSNDKVFVAARYAGLQVFDASNLSNPSLLSTIYPVGTNGVTYGVTINGSVAFVADGYAGLQILNISDESNPDLLSTFLVETGQVSGVVISGCTAFVLDDLAGLQIVDVSNLNYPRLLSTYRVATGSAQGVAISGNLVFLADSAVNLQILDITKGGDGAATMARLRQAALADEEGAAFDRALAALKPAGVMAAAVPSEPMSTTVP